MRRILRRLYRVFVPLNPAKHNDGIDYFWHCVGPQGVQFWTPRGMTEAEARKHIREMFPGANVVYVDHDSKVLFFRK